MGRYFTPRCIGLHVTLLVLLLSFGWLTQWQLGRALAGNTLSWAYTFEWPLFAGYAVYVWWQLIHDQPDGVSTGGPRRPRGADGDRPGLPPARLGPDRRSPEERGHRRLGATIDEETGGRGERFTEQTPEEAAALARYNRYLARARGVDQRRDAGPEASSVTGPTGAVAGERRPHPTRLIGAAVAVRAAPQGRMTAPWCATG